MSRCGCGKVPASFSHLVKQLSGGLEQSPEPGVWQVPAPPTRPASFPAGPFSSPRICGPSEVMVLHTFAHKFPSLTHCPAPFPHILVHSSIAHSSLQAATAPSWLHSQALLQCFNIQTFMCLWYSWLRPGPHLSPKQNTENILKAGSC